MILDDIDFIVNIQKGDYTKPLTAEPSISLQYIQLV